MEHGPAVHIPVMLQEMLATLSPHAGETYVDATFGAGGYASAIMDTANCQVIALDRDSNAVRDGAGLVDKYSPRLRLLEGEFADMDKFMELPVDGVVMDIGVSSMQLDNAERGFSFMYDGPLDMRMSQQGQTAFDILNNLAEAELADIIYRFGEERRSRAIARAIVMARRSRPISRTSDLRQIAERVLGKPRYGQKHPATRTFQALRIYINDELSQLERGLVAARKILKPGGRLVVVSFHSLEDRIVKSFLTTNSGAPPAVSRHAPEPAREEKSCFRLQNRKALVPTPEELSRNPRARSAKLRSAIYLGHDT
jgi:16S rRNA (cytosine1402-N4)-methyltransferase